ncbi:hypothetical protein BGZ70_007966 [Mortierella alpina]|uniref:Uncharacterized protein n=1 Tax=Mortierella alpina TaxID=64518 RepID=A0A9P6J584_MORAP|nr:hypothetical protein BGZ70_007966 [Mortierella alpina]
MLPTVMLSTRPAPSCIAMLRNSVRQSSILAAPRTTLARSPWTLQGHHHQRFLSTCTQPTRSTLTSRSWIAAGTATTCMVAPMVWARHFASKRNTAHCAADAKPNPVEPTANPADKKSSPPSIPGMPNGKDPMVNTKELSFGTAMGVCSGFLFKKLGKMFLLVAGLGFVTLQMLANAGYIQVNWILIESRFKEKFDLDQDGKVTVKDARFGLNWIIDLLTRNFQFKSTFAGGFYLGFRYG